jgi:hypothetical protein
MKPIEDTLSPEQIKTVDATARQALIRAEALTAVTQSGFSMPELLVPVLEKQLIAVAPGEGDPLRVVAIDEKGTILTGAKGPMTANELVNQLKTHPSFAKGWKQ